MADEWLQRKDRSIDGPMKGSKAGAEPGWARMASAAVEPDMGNKMAMGQVNSMGY